ncbi:Homeobox protein Hox-B5-like protein [Aix galericulata]|nr:Homeobox protein Hox-B5-like protein [Aix galericulata]
MKRDVLLEVTVKKKQNKKRKKKKEKREREKETLPRFSYVCLLAIQIVSFRYRSIQTTSSQYCMKNGSLQVKVSFVHKFLKVYLYSWEPRLSLARSLARSLSLSLSLSLSVRLEPFRTVPPSPRGRSNH